MTELLRRGAPSTDPSSSHLYALLQNVNAKRKGVESSDLQSNSKYDGVRGVTTGSSSGSCYVHEVSDLSGVAIEEDIHIC
jgi:hypothetical protein